MSAHIDAVVAKLEAQPVRPIAGWALFAPKGWIFHESVRRTRSQVIDYANNDAAPTWSWDRYRKGGFYIAKIEIRAARALGGGK